LPAGGVRWKGVREFLDDMPLEHCATKPPHEFCTICMRINYGVASDCPLFSRPYTGGATATVEAAPARPAAAATAAAAKAPREPMRDHVSRDDVRDALKGDDFPLIEFAGPRRAAAKGGAAAKSTAAPARRMEGEEPLDVAPLEVVPMEAPPKGAPDVPGPGVGGPAASAEPPEAGAAPAGQDGQARAKVDPEELMHRIMEELEIPEDEEEAGETGDASEGGAAGGPAEGRRDEGARGAGEAEGPKPRVVEKRIVLRKRKKGED